MKKVSYFLMAALFAATNLVFVSCGGDDYDPPTIGVYLNGETKTTIEVEVGETVTMEIQWEALGDIKEITLDEVNGSNMAGYPKSSDFSGGKTFHKETFSITRATVGERKFSTVITDKCKDTQRANVEITIKFIEGEPPVTPVTESDFTWTRVGSSAATGLDAVGLEWTSNTGNPIMCVIKPKTGTTLYELTAAKYTGVVNTEDLEPAFAGVSPIDDFRKISATASSTTNHVLGTKVGNDYYVISIANSTVTSGSSTTITITGKYKH